MREDSFDAIVIGAGLGGLCCAGELAVQGLRPLLISETNEVGAALAAPLVGGHRGVRQAPTHQVGWGGGWWATLARRLNVPINVPNGFHALGYDLYVEADPTRHSIPQTIVSASGLTSAFSEIFPDLSDAAPELERVLDVGLAIPYRELADMDAMLLLDWLHEQTADQLVIDTTMALSNICVPSTGAFCRDHLSVFGGIGGLRSVFCSEAVHGHVYPDNRRGLAIPFAESIERAGGTVWRGKRVQSVDVQHGQVGTVTLVDGTEVSAPAVALSCSNARTAQILDAIPPEAQPALSYGRCTSHREFHAYAVLDREILEPESHAWRGIVSADRGLLSWAFAIHSVPWHMNPESPGDQFVVAACCLPESELDERGSEAEIFERLHADMDFYNPGYRDATIVVDNRSHDAGDLWLDNLFAGPKLPRTAESVPGLYFVAHGSKPNYGLYMEAGASAGVLGARQIATDRADAARAGRPDPTGAAAKTPS